MYIRSKTTRGTKYYYLVEGRRVEGKVRQEIVAYLYIYPTVEEAYQYFKKRLAARFEVGRERFSKYSPTSFPEVTGWERERMKGWVEALEPHRNPAIKEAEKDTRDDRRRKRRESATHQKRAAQKEAEFQAGRPRTAWRTRVINATGEFPVREELLRALELTEDTYDVEIIKAAWRKLVMLHHPDKGGDATIFRSVQHAYDTLML